ncbi:MAG: ribonuclease HIII [Candidatus Aenigmarchaeota archaeon]|nr:ribonuclease HIII [Candidatus Aenigmarchaeota archaeon]
MPVKIGADEAGKGDYFGYLVVAAVAADEAGEAKLRALRVRDSKLVSDNEVRRLATLVKKVCRHEIVKISPEKYNALYSKFKNMNKILSWAHARAIENLLEKSEAQVIIVDKFADESVLKKQLFEKSRKAKVIQTVRGERDIVVAAASIIARAEFLATLRSLSLQVGYKLPKGAAHVDEALKFLTEKYGPDVLEGIAKLHFRTTKRLSAGKNGHEKK